MKIYERTKYEREKKEAKFQQGNGGTLECRVNVGINTHRREIHMGRKKGYE